ncbi:MAG: hypothetical protein QOJ40_2118 [Verrucomicrobiota bacterium]
MLAKPWLKSGLQLPSNAVRFEAPTNPPKIEFDLSVGAWYIRFRNTKVARTISEERPGVITAIDLDSHGRVIGVELIGVKEFTIQKLRTISPVDTSKIDFDKAKFVPAARCREPVSA